MHEKPPAYWVTQGFLAGVTAVGLPWLAYLYPPHLDAKSLSVLAIYPFVLFMNRVGRSVRRRYGVPSKD